MTSRSNPVARPTGVKLILVELFESMSEEEQEFLMTMAIEVRHCLKNEDHKAAWAACNNGLDQEEQMALWSLFDSRERSAINKGKP